MKFVEYLKEISLISGELLPWLGVILLGLQTIFKTIDREHFSDPMKMVARHATLCCEKVGYIAAFMARNGIIVSISLFTISAFSNMTLQDPWSNMRYGAMGFLSLLVIFHGGLVFAVSGTILKRYQKA